MSEKQNGVIDWTGFFSYLVFKIKYIPLAQMDIFNFKQKGIGLPGAQLINVRPFLVLCFLACARILF